MSHTIHIKPCKIKLCIESHSTGLSDRVRNTRRYAHSCPSRVRAAPDVFENHRSYLNSVHAEFSDLTDLIDHHESDLYLHFTVNPDGGYRTIGVGFVTTSSILIDRKHSLNDLHV